MPISAYASTPSLDDLANNATPTPAAAAPLGFFDKVKLGYKSAGAGADWGWNQHNYEVSAYHDIRSALEAKGYKLPDTPLLSSGDEADFYSTGYYPGKPWLRGPKSQERFDAFWNAFNDARAKDENFAATYKDVHDFGTLLDHVKAKRSADMADVATKAPDGLGAAGFVGGLGRGALDPMSWIPIAGPEVGLGLKFGTRLLAQGLKGAAINAGVTAGLEPFVQRDAGHLGVQRTAGDFVTDLLTSSALGGVVGAGHEAARLAPSIVREGSLSGGVRRFEADQFGKALNRAVNRADLPNAPSPTSMQAPTVRPRSDQQSISRINLATVDDRIAATSREWERRYSEGEDAASGLMEALHLARSGGVLQTSGRTAEDQHPRQALDAISSAREAGRADIVELIRDRAERQASAPSAEPGVPQDHESYPRIKARLEQSRAETRTHADEVIAAANAALQDMSDREAPSHSFDATVARTFSEVIPPEQRTPDEQAALHAVNRDAEIKSSSPFVSGPAGDDAHAGWLDQAMAVLHNAAPPLQSVKPVARESIAAPDDVAAARAPARELVKAKIHSAEGDGPNKLGGSALGPYQFEPRTWVDLFKRRYPNDQRGFDQIAALRTDPHLNDVLVNDLIAENAMRLRHAGLDESAGNLYLAHVLGADRAVAVLHANPEARLADILPHNYFDRNPFRPTDSAASLIHWAYGKMGDTSVPVHVATADAAAGAEAIGAGEGDPEVQPSTGRYEVAAMYSDIGMADRPVLRPELFDSPEEHAAAQLRFERQRDMADGFAPIMSRAEAFSPGDHFGALRGYTGKVTTEAIGEALGLSPEEVRRSVQSMMAIDRNSPFVLARERGTPADAPATRVMRRPKPPQSNKPETLIQFIKRIGGIDAAGAGDLVHISGGVAHVGKLADTRLHAAREALRNARFSKAPPALRDHQINTAKQRLDAAERAVKSDPRGVGLDAAMEAAVEAGFFPEMGFDAYGTKPDNSALLDAIDAELRGQTPRTRITDAQTIAEAEAEAQRERYGDQPDEAPVDRAERLFELTGHNQEAISEAAGRRGVVLTDDEMMLTASDLIDRGMEPDEALDSAIIDASVRDLEEFAAATGEMEYGPSHDAATYVGDHAEDRGGDGAGGEIGPGGGRSTADAETASAGGERFAQLAHDPAAGEFGNPVGAAAEAQADSTIHDLEMQNAPAKRVSGEVVEDPRAEDLWKLSTEELQALADEKRMSDNEKLLKAFGSEERVKRFKALDRQRNGTMDPRRADEGSRLFDREFGDLTPEQDRLVYGIGETDAQEAEIREVLKAHSDVIPGDDIGWAAYMAAHAAKNVTAADLTNVQRGTASARVQAEYIRLGRAYQNMAERGLGGDEILREMTKALVDRGGWHPGQAAEIISAFADDMKRGMAPAPGMEVKALPTPDSYRLDEDGGESDLGSILDEIEQAQKDAATMRDCIKPHGGAE